MKKLLAISLLFSTQMVFANKVKVLEVSPPAGFTEAPVIHVVSSDGDAWDSVDRSKTSAFKVGLQAQCRSGIKRKRQPYRGALHVPGFERVGPTLPSDAMIPETDSTHALFRFTNGAGQTTSAPKLCMDELARRLDRNPELSKHQIMARGFTLEVPAAFTANYTLTCLATGLGGTDMQTRAVAVNSRIECTASDLAAAYVPTAQIKISKAEPDPLITGIALQAMPEEFSGTCPVSIVFSATLTASRPGKASYRIISGSGNDSPVYEIVFDQAGTRQITGWQRTITSDTPPDSPITETTPALPADDPDSMLPDTASLRGLPGAEAIADLSSADTTSTPEALKSASPDKPASETTPGVEGVPGNHNAIIASELPAVETIQKPAIGNSEIPSQPPEAHDSVPVKIWDFIGWEQIEILAPEQVIGNQTRFAVDCR